ncbi:carbohydrate ABC transporter permease [Mycoplasmopsis columbinasalis]|uniref:sn-glycerol-3-phosphate transport system permease protein ugpA n=1 Tax=Mycoplasmopsis columbinasalis TaxID=114880 RepID=A0A449B9Q2_9BACT|nr:sugar ABC transporter permease [Mycoplasmopsis columbinasalis]VEU77911.1 sn-glycerol-3-phosphate transport system permease protein ugpA [Mycoplasmopsis columbinasalis]
MKLSSSFWAKLSQKFPLFYRFSAYKQSKNRANSLSYSIIEKETPTYKPLAILMPTIFIIILFTLIPLFLNFKDAFTGTAVTANGTEIQVFTFENFKNVVNHPSFAVGFRNSLIYGMLVLPLSLSVSLLISSCIVHVYRKWARGFWQTIFFLPYMTNAVAVSLTFLQLFAPNGFINKIFNQGTYGWLEANDQFTFRALVPLITQGVWGSLAFNVLILTTAMLSVDKNQYRSASIDGISNVKQFFSITLPSIKSTTTFLITIGIINGVKVFPLAIFNNDPSTAITNGGASLMLLVYNFLKTNEKAYAAASALALFGIGVLYSTIVRGGFRTIVQVTFNKGESDVWKKIKASTMVSKKTSLAQ